MPKVSSDGVGDKIVKMKDTDGKTWQEIADAVGLTPGRAMFEYEVATVTPKTRITAKTEEDLKAKIAAAREEGLSWGRIAARSGKSEGYCKKAFEEVSGGTARGHRIGKGGRFPDGEATPAKAKGATKAAAKAPKASKAVKKAAKKAPPSKKAVAKKTPIKKGVAKKAVAASE